VLRTVRRCGFCESTGQLTLEHVFATWIGPVVGLGQAGAVVQHAFRMDGHLVGAPWIARRSIRKSGWRAHRATTDG